MLSALFETIHERYRVERELGSGGMGTVYLATDLRQGTQVAIKVLRRELVPGVGVERFTREIRITSALQHPSILPILDAGQVDGLPYYVTPFATGESLARRLQREPQLPVAEAVRIACDIAAALTAAHLNGFVHRDIKPANILLQDGRAVLSDFGIARAMDVVTADQLTSSGIALGTPAYMSPEQSSCAPIDGRSDVYGLSCVLYEMLAGTPPFTGFTAHVVRARHMVDPPPSLRTVRPTVSVDLEDVILKALHKSPADRHASAEEFREALLTVPATVASGGAGRGWLRVRTRLTVAAVGLALAVVGGLLWRVVRPGGPTLDRNRVMVYPILVADGFSGSQTAGEDVATLISAALDGAGPLRWIDAWSILDPGYRADIRTLSPRAARSLARSHRCAFYLQGRLIARGDSAKVFLTLTDVAGDSTLVVGSAGGGMNEIWTLGLQAVNEVLPSLMRTDAADLLAEWKQRDPRAIASFLLGEAAFRRVHLSEALEHFRNAVAADSQFGLAALRGAQAAGWSHRPEEAASLVAVAALSRMPIRYTHFTSGFQAYLDGRPDSAAAELRRALAMDPEMGAAWLQLGEVYTHLLPVSGDPGLSADSAFDQAYGLDSSSSTALLHLIESGLRRGDLAKTEPLVRRFLAVAPEPELAQHVQIMAKCARDGPGRVRWAAEAKRDALAVLAAGKLFAAAGARLDCAIPAFAAAVSADTSAAGHSRWFALFLLQSSLLIQGRTREATQALDALPPSDAADIMYILDAPVFPSVEDRAASAASRYKAVCGADYAKCPNSYRVWTLGVWDAHEGRATEAEVASKELAARASGATNAEDRELADLLGRSVAAHAALARADTATAIGLFEALIAQPVRAGSGLEWDVARPRGLDRLRLAQLVLVRGDPERAVSLAEMMDSAAPSAYLLYLFASLELRRDAARALGDPVRAAAFERRLATLRGSRVPEASM